MDDLYYIPVYNKIVTLSDKLKSDTKVKNFLVLRDSKEIVVNSIRQLSMNWDLNSISSRNFLSLNSVLTAYSLQMYSHIGEDVILHIKKDSYRSDIIYWCEGTMIHGRLFNGINIYPLIEVIGRVYQPDIYVGQEHIFDIKRQNNSDVIKIFVSECKKVEALRRLI